MIGAYLDAAKEVAGESLANDLKQDIEKCNELLSERVGSKIKTVNAIGHLVADAGGKRLRPLFVGLAARASSQSPDLRRARFLGACLEMVHMATLIHDDVIDEARTRRGAPTPAVVWGNTSAILSGDVLLANAMRMLAEDGDLEIIRAVSEMVVVMAEGEVREVEVRGRFDLDRESHYEILHRKTAAFLSCCCRVGAMVGGGTNSTVGALARYGEQIGLAFQIADDLLDFRGDAATTGKPRGTDFRDGQATLPLILLRDKMSREESEFAMSRFGNGVTDGDLELVTSWMESRGCFEESETIAMSHARQAMEAVESLPVSDASKLLLAVSELIVKRVS